MLRRNKAILFFRYFPTLTNFARTFTRIAQYFFKFLNFVIFLVDFLPWVGKSIIVFVCCLHLQDAHPIKLTTVCIKAAHLAGETSSRLPQKWNGLAADVAGGAEHFSTPLHLQPGVKIWLLQEFSPRLSRSARTGPCCSGASRQRKEASHQPWKNDIYRNPEHCSPHAQVDRIFHPLLQ